MIKLSDIVIQFENDKVIDQLTTQFNEHETTVIVGPSGAGKSTILRTINLLNRPTSGTVSLDQTSFTFPGKYNENEINHYRQNYGMVFQDFNLFPHLTVLENVIEGPTQVRGIKPDAAKKMAQKLLAQVGLAEKADAYPNALSGGQQQRVAIARALAMEPKFMLYDEPTSALDPELEGEVLKVIQDLAAQQKSQIVVTHNMYFAQQIADRILFVEDGAIKFDGKTKDFFNNPDERIKNFTSLMLHA